MADPGGGQTTTEQETENNEEGKDENIDESQQIKDSKTQVQVHDRTKYDKKEKKTKEQSIPSKKKVELSKMRPKYNNKSHSTMTNVLTEYGLPEEDKRKPKSKSQATHNKKQSPKKIHRESTFDSTTGDEGDRISKSKKEKYMQVYEDIHKLRDYFYEDYMIKLNNKVHQQREDIQKKSEAMDNKLREREERERKNRLKKRLERVDVGTNEEYLRKIHKSDFYKIITLQDKLMSDGKLKNQEDIDDFWRNIRRPEVFKKHFPDTPSESTNSHYTGSHLSQTHSRSSSLSSLDKNPVPSVIQSDFHPMTQIEETAETSRPTTSGAPESWAITQQAQAVHKAPARKIVDPYNVARTAAIELDRKYPQLELPKLHCFNPALNLTEIELHQILKEKEKERREKERRLFVMRLRRMYHLTQSNQASAQRILDKHADEFELARNGPPLSELMALSAITADPLIEQKSDDPYAERPWLRHLVSKRRDIQTIEELPEEGDFTARGSSITSSAGGSSTTSASSKKSKREKPLTPPHPISRELLEDTAPIKEARCISTMWTNYLRIGFHGDLAQLQKT